jgi:hypothetical protein
LAILDATKLNPVNLHSLDRTVDDELTDINTRINRLVPWLYNAQHKKTNDMKIINELNRI